MQRYKWDGEQPDDYRYRDQYEVLWGIVMEFFDDSEQVDLRRADLALLENIAEALRWIHSVVPHGDISENSILLVKENGISRVVWIGFSRALAQRDEPWTWGGDINWRRPPFLCSKEWDQFRNLLLENTVSSTTLDDTDI